MITLDKNLLSEIKYFNTLQENELEIILQAPENSIVEYSRKDVIFTENEVGEHMFIMLEGLAEVYVRSNTSNMDINIASLKPGDVFGDGAATSEEQTKRTATVKVAIDTKVFKIHKKYVLNAFKDSGLDEALPPDEIRDLLLTIPLFKGLSDEEIKDVKSWTKLIEYKKDDLIHEPGKVADNLFVILEGKIRIFILDTFGKKHVTSEIDMGQYFGEIELLPGGNGKHYQYAEALTDCRIIHVSKKIFDALTDRNKTLVVYLKQMNQLKKISRDHTEKGA